MMALIPGVLWRYFLISYLRTFLWVLLSVGMLIFLIDMVELSRRTSGIEGFSLGIVIGVSILKTPSLLMTYVQFLVLIASMMVLLSLNARQELVIARASGVSVWQFIMPIATGSLLIGLVAVGIVSPLAAAAQARAETLAASNGFNTGGDTRVVPWFRQKNGDETIVIGARAIAEQGTRLSQAQVIVINADGRVVQRIDARQGVLRNNAWVLNNAVVYENGQAGRAEKQVRVPSTINADFLKQAMTNSSAVPFLKLPESMRAAEAFGLPTGRYAMEWHGLIALPAFLIAMTLIAATVSLRFARFGQSSTAILGGIVAGFLLYVVDEMAGSLGAAEAIAPVVAAWLPVTAAGLFGVTFLLHREDG
ncbi:MAG: LptF/LptG family permease [Rhizobiaceae bacterium]|jgi:lipopolysaccharide export system permease protein|nr:LptF/LptG family permease [Rhizobiaceae bacterium]